MGKPSAPAAPDPTRTADEQIRVNHQSMEDWLSGNRINQVTPGGSLTYAKDPETGVWTQTNALSPEMQALYEGGLKNSGAGQQLEGDALSRILGAGTVGSALDTSGLSRFYTGGDISNPSLQTSIGTGAPLQTSLAGADPRARQQTIDAVYGQAASRLDPQFASQEQATKAELAAKGITRESNPEAYDREMSAFQRAKTDAYNTAQNSAITQGGAEQSRLFDIGKQAGEFGNAAKGQTFAQALAAAGFGNQAKGQTFQQSLAKGQFGNQSRAQQLAELLTGRQEPLNELNMLKGLGTTKDPTYQNYALSGNQAAPNMGQLYGNQYQGQLNAYNAQQGGMNSLMSSLGPLAMMLLA